LVNAALVYLFNPTSTKLEDRQALLVWTLLVALAASHVFLVLKAAISYLVERFCWKGSREELDLEEIERQVKHVCLKRLDEDVGEHESHAAVVEDENVDITEFWKVDEGLQEIQRVLKDS
jgi:hypothetical protein